MIPVFNEEENLPTLLERLETVRRDLALPCEIVLVDDGSSDSSPEMLRSAASASSGIKAVILSRNFGHQLAITAGMRHTTGKAVVIMDADLQDPPELLPKLLEKWREGYHVVYARRTSREKEGIVKRSTAWLFYRMLRKLLPFDVPVDVGDFCMMDRRIVDHLNSLPERHRYVRGLRSWLGYRQTAVEYERPPRFAGEPKYTFSKSLRLAIDAVLSLSPLPLRLATYFGLASAGLSVALGIYFIAMKLLVGFPVVGWASTIVVILFLGGVQLVTIGIGGEYISRIYDEVKQRPIVVVAEVVPEVPARSSRD